MRKFNLLLLAAIGTVMLYLLSCRKTDHQLGQPDNALSSPKERFFNTKGNLDPEINSLMEFVRRANSKKPFIEKTVEKIGYPLWDKPLKTRKQPQTLNVKVNGLKNNGTATAVGQSDVYYIPFKRDSENFVNAAMIIKVSPKDTSISYICNWQYRKKEHGSATGGNTAERHALFFMLLDNHALGHTEFNITDISLFPAAASRSGAKKLKLLPKPNENSNGKKDQIVYYEECTDYYVCGDPYGYCLGGCDYMNCISAPGMPAYCYLALQICQTWWEYDDGDYGGGGGTYAPSEGSEGGGGSGSVPPDPCDTGGNPPPINLDKNNPQSGGRVSINSAQNDCSTNPGWTPDPYSTEELIAFGNNEGWYWDDPVNFAPVVPYDPNIDGLYRSDGFRRNGPAMQFYKGTVQNWINDAGKKIATFTGIDGKSIDFPDAYIVDNIYIPYNKAFTGSDGTIHASNTFGLADLQHEYGHVLQIKKYGIGYYGRVIMPSSLLNMILSPSTHRAFWTEKDANWLAVSFFGFASDIAKDYNNFPY